MKKLLIIPLLFFILVFSSCEKPAQKYGSIFDAVNHMDTKAVEDFVQKDPKLVNETDDKGVPVLIYSITKGRPAVAEILVNNGAEVNVRDPGNLSKDYTPLHWAAKLGNNDLARLLLDKGADPNSVNKAGETPLHLTASAGKTQMAIILIEKGANMTAKDAEGLTPMDKAKKNGKDEYAQFLKEKMESMDGMQKKTDKN